MATVTIGRDPETGKPKPGYFYGKTRQEVAEQLNKALTDKKDGTLVVPNKITVGEWLDTWLNEYAKPHVRPTTWASYEQIKTGAPPEPWIWDPVIFNCVPASRLIPTYPKKSFPFGFTRFILLPRSPLSWVAF